MAAFGVRAGGDNVTYFLELRLSERPRAGADELQAVVVNGVVGGCHHKPEAEAQGAAGVVNFLRPAEAEVQDVGARVCAAPRRCAGIALRSFARVVADDCRCRAEGLDSCARHALDEVSVNIFAHDAANVVGLKCGGVAPRSSHSPSLQAHVEHGHTFCMRRRPLLVQINIISKIT